ncbi:formate/nitrite transporter family protein [Azospirillum sp. TSO35-2]|uniref:formate/nitrite transporter family protein n=1 Tax=Azospirillum sp. TSO35-2 TaxID=716796 RepID=UPI000D619940|nr:formate/nitrite transporter family protein [Azospirillum sp. TSO35-2]PWC33353.1 transporter [Azospirillum sp. TSO35-2]
MPDVSDPRLDQAERDEVKERSNPPALILHEAIRLEGEEELKRPTASLLWSGLAAGLSMGFSMVGEALLMAHLPDEPWRPLVASFGYCFGFLIVILGRQQLFTENTLTVILPLLHRWSAGNLMKVARLWTLVFVANIVGTLLFSAFAAGTPTFTPALTANFAELGRNAADSGFWTTTLHGVLAGWLIALLVWITPSVGQARFFVIVALTYLIALGKFAHVVAGSVEVSFAAMTGEVSWSGYAFSFLLPSLIGNVLGGVGLVALINHAQVRQDHT